MSSGILKNIKFDILKCVRCGRCRSICPTLNYQLDLEEPAWETSCARGRVLMAYGLQQSRIRPSEKLVNSFYNCVICNHCVESCPSGVDPTKIIQAVRKEILDQQIAPVSIYKILNTLKDTKNIFGLDQDDRLLWSEINVEEIVEDKIQKHAKFAFFVGCQGSYKGSLSGIPEAIILILDYLKIDFTILGDEEWCCGSPFFLVGDGSEAAKEFVFHNIEKMKELEVENIIFTCPGCYRVWKNEYPKIYGGNLPFKLFHSTEFIAKLIEEGKIGLKKEIRKRVGYQDPCELGRHCGIFEEPRTVIKSIPGIDFKELLENREGSICCGGGGLAKVTDDKISLGIGLKKISDFTKNDVDLIITCCPACQQNLQDASEYCKSEVEIKDLNELFIEALDID
ncbi:MAG: (Fe-S)-binding protein [Candidatus Helarchaeota archaeon]